MGLSDYHQKQRRLSDQEIERRLNVKSDELAAVFSRVAQPVVSGRPVRVGVLGCADIRYVSGHQKLFASILGLPIDLTTFDITVDHLAGAPGVVQHDCTLPLPDGPFDVLLAHVLLKFLDADGQLALVQNGLHALNPGGVFILVNDQEELTYGLIDVKNIKQVVEQSHAAWVESATKYGVAWVIVK